jgi:predicted kinase
MAGDALFLLFLSLGPPPLIFGVRPTLSCWSYRMTTLFTFAGLPGVGKTTLSQHLVRRIGAVYLQIDTVEQALRDLCRIRVQGEGYRLLYRIASDNLRLGISVIADSCNPIELTRGEWEQVAAGAHAEHVNIEVICSDPEEHRRRVTNRIATVPGLQLPTWDEVINREYHRWIRDRIVIDTSGKSETESVNELLSALTINRTEGFRVELNARNR